MLSGFRSADSLQDRPDGRNLLNGYLLTLVIVLIAFVVIALARMLGHHNLPHPHQLSSGNNGQDADDRRDTGKGEEDNR